MQARNHLYTEYKANPFLILRRESYLSDADITKHLLLPMENQAAWLRSVKEAIQVRKHHDDCTANSRKEWFKSFFIKVSRPSSSASPQTNTNTPPIEPVLLQLDQQKQAPRPERATSHLTTINASFIVTRNTKKSLIRVKGWWRLFKFATKSSIQPNSSAPELGQPISPVPDPSIITGPTETIDPTASPASDADSQLLQPSGLRMVNKAKRSVKRGHCRHRQTLKTPTGKENHDLSRSRKSKLNCQVEIPHNGHLEFFGFHAIIPKKGNSAQKSTVVAETELNDYSGTYVSTVP